MSYEEAPWSPFATARPEPVGVSGIICPEPSDSYTIEWDEENYEFFCQPVEGAPCYAFKEYDAWTGHSAGTFLGTFMNNACVVNDCTDAQGRAGKQLFVGDTVQCAHYLMPGKNCSMPGGAAGHLNSERQCVAGEPGDGCTAPGGAAGVLDAAYDCIPYDTSGGTPGGGTPGGGGGLPPGGGGDPGEIPQAPDCTAEFGADYIPWWSYDEGEWFCFSCRANEEGDSASGLCYCKDGLVRSDPNDPNSACVAPQQAKPPAGGGSFIDKGSQPKSNKPSTEIPKGGLSGQPTSRGEDKKSIWPWLLGGVAVAAVGTAVYFAYDTGPKREPAPEPR